MSFNSFESTQTGSTLVALFYLFIASFFYNVMVIPIKHFKTGDGMCYQLFILVGVWIVVFVTVSSSPFFSNFR
jgi:hypothetical protein